MKKRNRGNKKRFNNKRDSREMEKSQSATDVEDRGHRDKTNALQDISWYSKNMNLLISAASVPYPYKPGMAVPVGSVPWLPVAPYTPDRTGTTVIPGVLRINWAPSLPNTGDVTDPINVAAKEIYGRVRAAYSGTLQVDPPDFMIYVMALDSICAAIGSLKRIYRVLNTYSPNNFIVPDVLVQAMGLVDVNQLSTVEVWKENRMQLFNLIEQLISQTEKFILPDEMDVFNRHYWLNDNVYTDAETAKSQFYVFYASQYFKYALVDTPDKVQAGGLVYTTIDFTSPITAYNSILSWIEALASSEDAYTISGYLQRAYEGRGFFRVDRLTFDERFEPVFVPEVLSQIENAQTISFVSQGTDPGPIVFDWSQSVSQDPLTNTIKFTPMATVPASLVNPLKANGDWRVPISIRNEMPSVAETVIATRMKTLIDLNSLWQVGSNYQINVLCNTEVYVDMQLILKDRDGYINIYSLPSMAYFEANSGSVSIKQLMSYCYIQQFDWHPMLWLTCVPATYNSGDTVAYSSKNVDYICAGDVHNLTTISKSQLEEINRVCAFSEFNAFGLD